MFSHRFFLVLACFFVTCFQTVDSLQWNLPNPTEIRTFGSPVLFPDGTFTETDALVGSPVSTASASRYAQSELTLLTPQAGVVAPEKGQVVFVQRDGESLSGLPTPLGSALAIVHPDNFMTIFSGLALAPGKVPSSVEAGENLGRAAGTGTYLDGTIGIQVYDLVKTAWVNPIQFISGPVDEASPEIKQIALSSSASQFVHSGADSGQMKIPQGTYEISLQISDPGLSKAKPSGAFRLRLLVDGEEKANKSLSLALPTEDGLSFMGAKGPSSAFIDWKGRCVLTQVFLPRGIHQLDVFAADYAGNSSSVKLIADVF